MCSNERRYLFDVREIYKQRAEDNKTREHPEIAAKLEGELHAKAETWATPGLPEQVVAPDWMFSELHVERTLPPPPRPWQAAMVHGHR